MTLTEASLRADVRAWVASSWDPSLSLRAWRERFVDSGWAVPSWPERWFGKGMPAWADDVVRREVQRCGAVATVAAGPAGLAGPTILEQGPDAARERFLRPLLTGEEVWCQLFSEPSAGSDLAGLTTTAVLDGDEWVVNGQKVWTTSAHHADHGMLLARTDWDAPKHRGITWFVLPMQQPGVEPRPLRQMNGHASFNEVFLTDARVPADNVVGDPGDGWKVALTTLAHERGFGALTRPRYVADQGRTLREAEAEAEAHFTTYRWYPQRAGRVDLVIEHARAAGRGTDPVVRQAIVDLLARQRAHQWTAQRAQANRALGRPPGPEGSLGKLALSQVARAAAAVHAGLAGADGMLTGPAAPFGGVVAEVLVSVPAQSIAGGTDEVQRNIIGERVLGLPKEPAPDRDLPFREVRRGEGPGLRA